jgi:hypothetical protein
MLDRANDLITYRIDSVLNEISTMSLCDLPEDEPITPDTFLQHTEVNLNQNLILLCSFFLNRIYVIKHQNKFK